MDTFYVSKNGGVFGYGALIMLCSMVCASAFGQSHAPAISLDPPQGAEMQAGASTPRGPANFRQFGVAEAGVPGDIHQLTLRFAETTKLTKITSTRDFPVEQGSSCVAGNVYAAKTVCTLLVRFTPQGAGRRLGRLVVSHTSSPTPFTVSLGGTGYAPALSFTPAVISTVPGTFPSGVGLLSNAKNLTVDGSDSLYIADTGNNLIRLIDSSGAITTISSGGFTAPLGVAVDSFGEVFFSEPGANRLWEIYAYGPQFQLNGNGTDTCTVAAPCKIGSEALFSPGQMSMDSNDNLFFADRLLGAAVSAVQPAPGTLAHLFDPFTYQTLNSGTFAVDANDTLYSLWDSVVCQISSQTFSNAANSVAIYRKVAGGRICGFSGDGGLAGNAEVSAKMGQFAFDVAGNFYFTDTGNQRVRRIDAATGIINTIAGNGTAGYSGDGGAATLATLSSPTGLGVDSQGQVYVMSSTTTTGTAQVIRKLGPNGSLAFGSQLKGVSGAAQLVTVANTGNSTFTLTRAYIGGANAGDFSIDPNTTSCNLSLGANFYSGQSCKVGVIFKASAAGARSAALIFLGNTVTNSNTVLLSGTGTLPSPAFAITSPAPGASFTSSTAIKFSTSVTSTSGLAPTGTVKFSVDGVAHGSPVTISSGMAAVTLSGLSVGKHTLSASYSGDANYAPAGPLNETINITAGAIVLLGANANPAPFCTSVVFKIAVTASTGGYPTGNVHLQEGSRVLGGATLKNGGASVTMLASHSGVHWMTASYGGDANHSSAVSLPFKETVSQGGTCASTAPSF